MFLLTFLQRVKGLVAGSKTRRLIASFAALLAFAAAVATLWGPTKAWLWPREFHVYVLYPEVVENQEIWDDFGNGLNNYLASQGGRLDGLPVGISGKYELLFRRKSWSKDQDLPELVEEILDNPRALAVVAATSSQQAEVILARLREEEDRPLLLLATATKNGLVRQIVGEGELLPLPGVFRMVPRNEFQAERLASSILSPALGSCPNKQPGTISVAILREEHDNAAFSRDLASALRRALEEAQKVEILVDAVVDSMLTVPGELVEMEPDFLVYIGPQSAAASVYRQLERLRRRIDPNLCLPRLLLTDAGLLGDRNRYYRGLVESSLAALPFSGKAAERDGGASFASLGWDSGLLLHKAAVRVLNAVGARRLSRADLNESMAEVQVKGRAHYYEFEEGENKKAEFHLWAVANGIWEHDGNCTSKEDETLTRVASQAGVRPFPAKYDAQEKPKLRIGAKPFPEQRILAAIAVEALTQAGIPAQLGQESLNGIRDLLLFNRIDAYWEYTGTALYRAHGLKGLRGTSALERLRHLDGPRMVWMDPLPFDNTYLLLARAEWLDQSHVETISQLASYLSAGREVRLCANSDWFHIKDGLKGLQENYGFEWPAELQRPLPLELVYDQPETECDLVVGFASDARLLQTDLQPLVDDLLFFPEYQPALVVREDVYRNLVEKQELELAAWNQRLACIKAHLGLEKMRELNRSVELDQESPAEVAKRFLAAACPISSGGGPTRT